MRRKKWIAVMCLLLIFMLGACGKNSEVSEDTSGIVQNEVSESIDNSETNECPENYTMAVIVTINPQIKLYLDSENVIVFVEYLNADAKMAFADIELSNVAVEEGMEMIIHAAVEKEFLIDGKDVNIDVAEVRDENCAVEEVCTEVELAVVKATEENNVNVVVTTQVTAEIVENEPSDVIEDISSTSEEEPILEQESEQTPEPTPEQPISESCASCSGTGICPECGGGTLPCKRCGGSLWESCGVCGGDGNQICPGCKGSGTISVDGSTCNYCGGAGGISCEVCGGSGGESCSICNGKGVVSDDCILCHGGKDCTVCGGTGKKQ